MPSDAPLYGPPPHPLQVEVPAGLLDAPLAWGVSLIVGLLLTLLAWRLRERPGRAVPAFVTGQVVLLTAPWLGMLPRAVFGAYPTIDKQGSLLFYLEGVHRTMVAHPLSLGDYPPARLIGVHVGHLWLTELFDLLLPTFGAFSMQGMLYAVLAWWAGWWLLRTVTEDARVALVLAFPFAMGLHLFRDLNWYTVEKAAIFPLPLYAGCWIRSVRDGGAWPVLAAGVVAVAAFLNLYSALVLGLLAAVGGLVWLALVRGREERRRGLRRQAAAHGLTVLLLAPLIVAQAQLLQGQGTLSTPECFLEARAALDTFTLAPLAWNRLEAWRALNLVAVGLAASGAVRHRGDRRVVGVLVVVVAFFLLSLGPRVMGVHNPVYMAAWHALPFFWRIAKPEVFFHVSWLGLLVVAAVGLAGLRPQGRTLVALYALFALAWLASVRTHEAYPRFTEFVPGELAPGWEDRLLTQRECR